MTTIKFKPETNLTFKTVVTVRNQLYQAMAESPAEKFCLDLSAVNHCDSAGLALIIEARKLCKQKNKIFDVVGISPETQSLAEFCGVKSLLQFA
ncbi:STAS domain-containing protein [Legionella waltersii]|uniref:Putative anti-sigma-B factor antagonist (Anti-anti-sigma-B factor) n=1 Tax=Legionella waltersii TaxID=66969 RepID=A0A0W1ANB7_9GAMM|nr:STAS domain-containing protein [Legionella waltersii]KTD82833.1 putative anti-sigma-B factor antagonist (Anti-anti-sigma-B factor) [Legionella waltersii]SNV01650.1 putative anti-sigma-B factor antagonist (Anti-anti-sigma-B factor) [Legionella waltersii]